MNLDPSTIKLLLGFAAGLIAFLFRDWFTFHRKREWVSRSECDGCRAKCRAEIEKELLAGDVHFDSLGEEISLIRQGVMALVLTMIPMCEELTNHKVDCVELQKIAAKLAK